MNEDTSDYHSAQVNRRDGLFIAFLDSKNRLTLTLTRIMQSFHPRQNNSSRRVLHLPTQHASVVCLGEVSISRYRKT